MEAYTIALSEDTLSRKVSDISGSLSGLKLRGEGFSFLGYTSGSSAAIDEFKSLYEEYRALMEEYVQALRTDLDRIEAAASQIVAADGNIPLSFPAPRSLLVKGGGE